MKIAVRLYLLTGLLLFFCSWSKSPSRQQQLEALLRSVGNEFLLQLGDSTSRILPIQADSNRLAIHFQHPFAFEPDALINAVYDVFDREQELEPYIVETIRCDGNEVVHSFKINGKQTKDLVACKLRALPEHCYVFYFTPLAEEGVVVQKSIQTTNSTLGIVFLLLIIASIWIFKLQFSNRKKETTSENIKIGAFTLDAEQFLLTSDSERVELSAKEADLLHLLFLNQGQTVHRSELLAKVWGDEGDYIGRTLDVFISKLRKKLVNDATIKIITIRGVGYRLVIESAKTG